MLLMGETENGGDPLSRATMLWRVTKPRLAGLRQTCLGPGSALLHAISEHAGLGHVGRTKVCPTLCCSDLEFACVSCCFPNGRLPGKLRLTRWGLGPTSQAAIRPTGFHKKKCFGQRLYRLFVTLGYCCLRRAQDMSKRGAPSSCFFFLRAINGSDVTGLNNKTIRV